MEFFNYARKDNSFNELVDSVIAMARASKAGERVENYAEAQKELNSKICEYAVKNTPFEADFTSQGLSLFKNPQVTSNPSVRSNFSVVIAQVLNAVTPEVASADYARFLADVHQVGWGDTARFLIDNNELFFVNEIAEGVQRGILQPIYNDEVTVNCAPIQVATSIDWYQVAAGVFDWGKMAIKAARSFEGYIFLKIVAAMGTAISGYGAAYSITGIADYAKLAARVSAANGGAPVYGIGTLVALNMVMPSVVGLQYGLGQELAKEGYLDKYLGTKLIPLDQALVPGTINSTALFAVPDNKIYLVAADSNKPVKLVFEGDAVTVQEDKDTTTDKTYGLTITMRIGVSAVIGSKIGCITLE